MVIGNGLIAGQFNKYRDNDNVIIFASGVSNSKETNSKLFDQEFNLIKKYISKKSLFVYFSTCSVHDSSLTESNYVKHKLKVEKFIQSNFENFLILRLPNIIGLTKNPHTFFNYFYNSIKNGESILIQKNAVRYFMDVEDISVIFEIILEDNTVKNTVINISYRNAITISDAVTLFEEELNKKANLSFVPKGNKYVIPDEYFFSLCSKIKRIDITDDYTRNCFRKYINKKNKEDSI
jgi:nucleoside-diphosphate-sugar epimerase